MRHLSHPQFYSATNFPAVKPLRHCPPSLGTFRPIQPSDYAATSAIRNSAAAEPVSVEVFTEWCELDPVRNTHYYNLVAVDNADVPLGYVIACINEHLPQDCWYITVTVHPDARRHGVGGALYVEAEQLTVSHGATTFMSEARSEDEGARPWAEHRGYICTRERTESVMDLDGRDAAPFQVIAMDGGRVAGVCIINLPRSAGQGAMIGFTGVSRAYRGRGLALALKVVATDEAKRGGVNHIRTNNDNDNPAILAVNAKLGYKPVPGPLRFKKHLL